MVCILVSSFCFAVPLFLALQLFTPLLFCVNLPGITFKEQLQCALSPCDYKVLFGEVDQSSHNSLSPWSESRPWATGISSPIFRFDCFHNALINRNKIWGRKLQRCLLGDMFLNNSRHSGDRYKTPGSKSGPNPNRGSLCHFDLGRNSNLKTFPFLTMPWHADAAPLRTAPPHRWDRWLITQVLKCILA